MILNIITFICIQSSTTLFCFATLVRCYNLNNWKYHNPSVFLNVSAIHEAVAGLLSVQHFQMEYYLLYTWKSCITIYFRPHEFLALCSVHTQKLFFFITFFLSSYFSHSFLSQLTFGAFIKCCYFRKIIQYNQYCTEALLKD